MGISDEIDRASRQSENVSPPIYIVSGGMGASGEQLAHTVLAQFPDSNAPVIRVPKVRKFDQIRQVVKQAASDGGTIVHTLVDAGLRAKLVSLAKQQRVVEIDVMGSLLDRLTSVLGKEPINQPGLYRQLHQAYFDRVEAIEYSMTHDDGKHPDGWKNAEIMITGVSRTGKTPLSLYLSVLGWKVANTPVIVGIPVQKDLFEIDRKRVVGLHIEPGQLLLIRQQRQIRLGAGGPSDYTNPEKVFDEVEYARKLFKKSGFSVVDVTDKPIETSAEEILNLVTRE